MILTLVELTAIAAFAAIGTVMSLDDVRHHTVKNRDLTVLLIVPLLIAVGMSGLAGSWSRIIWALAGAAAYAIIYALLAVAAKGQLGSGDVWISAGLGLLLGALHPPALVVGWATPFALAALPSVVFWISRGKNTRIALAPFIIFSAPLSVLVSGAM